VQQPPTHIQTVQPCILNHSFSHPDH